jgi:hypothetical protein
MKSNFNNPPIGIMVTWGKDMIQEKGGLLAFIRYFEQTMQEEDSLWLQKSKNRPAQDISIVYIVVCNQVRYKLFYGGYQTGETTIHNGDGHSWSSRQVISWPRLVLAGPVVKAPHKIKQKGFQGFRYVTEELF